MLDFAFPAISDLDLPIAMFFANDARLTGEQKSDSFSTPDISTGL